MRRKFASAGLAVVTVLMIVNIARPEITAEQVRAAIQRAQAYLVSEQSKTKGNWSEHVGQPGGVTALCTLALLHSGLEVKDPAIQRALDYLRSLQPQMTYSTALQTMVFCAAQPEKDRLLIRRNVRWLERIQLNQLNHPRRGAWAYSDRRGNGDNSNSQFALLALHEADRAGIEVSERTWRLALDYWLDCQKPDGSWGYFKGQPSTGSMTCAGIASLMITMDKLREYQGDAQVERGRVRCCGKRADAGPLQKAIDWLSSDIFSVQRNPSPASGLRGALGRANLLYYLYALERVGRFSGRRFFGRHDWYREGAELLVARQDSLAGYWVGVGSAERNPHVATSFALLFLCKGQRPVVIAKYKYRNDAEWDLHRRGVHDLTRSVEQRWKQPLTWQTIDANAATVNDLLETPVLFISGRSDLRLDPEQQASLRQYVNQGGFIFAEACNGDGCRGEAFDRDFRALVQQLFPESRLRPLPPDHPIWYAERKVVPQTDRWLWGLDACCRTSVVYCPSNLSCYWELAGAGSAARYPKTVQQAIDECLAIGQNVLAYATNRQVKAKLERPQMILNEGPAERRARGLLIIPKLSHSGGSDDAPNAVSNLLNLARYQLDMKDSISPRTWLIAPEDPALLRHPIVFIHGRRAFRFTAAQRKALATYLERGGFVFGDAICASPQFAQSFRRELKAMFPDRALERIPADHPLFSQQYGGYDLTSVTLRSPGTGGEREPLRAKLSRTEPYLEALQVDGRMAVVFSPYDISCALEHHASLECKGYPTPDAAKIALNILLYALQQ